MNTYKITFTRENGTVGSDNFTAPSEAQARRLQIEGFVGDVVTRCGIEPLCGAVMELASAKMEKL